MATFRKSKSGEWVVYGTVREVVVGKVKVSKKDGSTRRIDVTSVGRPFQAQGQTMVYGYIGASKGEEPARHISREEESEYGTERAAEMRAMAQADRLADFGPDYGYADMF